MSGLRVMLLTQDYPPEVGGIQTYAHAMASHLAELCDEFCVVAPAQSGAGEIDAAQPFETIRVRANRDWMRATVLPSLFGLARRFKPDAILTAHWYLGAPALALRRFGMTQRVFAAAHGQELLKSLVPAPLTPLYSWHRRSVLRALDGVFPVSRYTGELLLNEGVSAERICVVNNGTEVERFGTLDAGVQGRALRDRLGLDDHPTLFTVARLVERKGIDTVIESLPELCSRHPDLRYLIVGDGPDRQRLQGLVKNLGLERVCHFIGALAYSELPGAYCAGHVFVMPARAVGASVEGFGLSFCEAGASRRPVIGSLSGGIPDAVEDGVTGLLVPPGLRRAFTEAAHRLLADPELAERLGRQGRSRIEQGGTWAHAAERIYEHLESVCFSAESSQVANV